MTKPNEYYAYFTVVGDFSPVDMTARIGLNPNESWQKGDRNERTHMERKFSRWSLYSRLSRSEAIEKQVKDVTSQLKPAAQKIREVASEYESAIMVVGYFHVDYPGMSFEPQLLQDVGALDLGMEFDFYYMYSDKREDS